MNDDVILIMRKQHTDICMCTSVAICKYLLKYAYASNITAKHYNGDSALKIQTQNQIQLLSA